MEEIISSKAVNGEEKYLLELLDNSDFIKDYYLAGGTALAILFDHRESIDLDFFTKKKFNEKDLEANIKKILKKEVKTTIIKKGTLYLKYKKTTMSFLYYNYPLLEKLIRFKNLRMCSLRDIGAMKIAAIIGRNTKKDFIDLYFLLKRKFSLFDLINLYINKYGENAYNEVIVSKSLMNFDEADLNSSPKMYEDFNWESAKKFIINETKYFFKSFATRS